MNPPGHTPHSQLNLDRLTQHLFSQWYALPSTPKQVCDFYKKNGSSIYSFIIPFHRHALISIRRYLTTAARETETLEQTARDKCGDKFTVVTWSWTSPRGEQPLNECGASHDLGPLAAVEGRRGFSLLCSDILCSPCHRFLRTCHRGTRGGESRPLTQPRYRRRVIRHSISAFPPCFLGLRTGRGGPKGSRV